MFGFQRLDVYCCAVEFLAVAAGLADRTAKGNGELSDQLRRAAISVPLKIAEGSGKVRRDAARFYTIARGSALECAAILDAFEALRIANAEELQNGRELLARVVSMLTKLRRSAS